MKTKWKLLLILGIFGFVMTYLGVKDWIVLSKPAKDITALWEADYQDLKVGDHVCFDVNLVWDLIGSQVTERKTLGITTSETESARYYLLPFCQDTEDGYLYPTPYLLVKLGSQYNSTMDGLIEKTEQWWDNNGTFDEIPSSSLHFDGRLEKLPNDVRKQLSSSLDAGETLEDYMLPVLFVPIAVPGAAKGMTIAGILCLMVFLAILFFVLRGEATATPQPIPGVRKEPFVPQGGDPGAVFAQQPQGGTFGSEFAQQGTGINTFGSAFAQQPQSGTFGTQPVAAPQQPATSQSQTASQYSTATLETTQIPYIPGYSYGPDPSKQNAGSPQSTASSPLGPVPTQTVGSTSPLGPSTLGPTPGQSGSSYGAPSSLQQPYGTTPEPQSVGSGYGSTPVQQPVGSGYGTAPVQSSKPPVQEEDGPLYADNTEMKSVFKGAFANSIDNGNNS